MTDCKSTKAPHRGGFTMLEVFTTLILLGILTAIAVSIIPSSTPNLVTEADRLKSHLRYAQLRAQADTYEWRLIFTNDTTYQIGPVVFPGQGFIPKNIPGAGGTQATLSDGVSATDGTVIRFDSWGRPMDDTNTLLSANQTITLTGGGRSETITIQVETGLIP